MEGRTQNAVVERTKLRNEIMEGNFGVLLKGKCVPIYELVRDATGEIFKDVDFRCRSWSTTQGLRDLSENLKSLKKQIKILHKRDYLSITPKLEDIALVNRWVQSYDVPHFYLQVFFDKGYVMPFSEILEIASDSAREGFDFSVEKDVKNQQLKSMCGWGEKFLGKLTCLCINPV